MDYKQIAIKSFPLKSHTAHILLTALMVFGFTTALATPVKVYDDAPAIYTVKPGDTLWGIANKYLPQAWQWDDLLALNPGLKKTTVIKPGDQLVLKQDEQGEQHVIVKKPRPQIRGHNATPPIQALDITRLHHMLEYATIIDPERLQHLPKIGAIEQGHLTARPGFRVYVDFLPKTLQRYFAVIRASNPLIRPGSKKVLGFLVTNVGQARIDNKNMRSPSLMITDTRQEIMVGDRLMDALDLHLPDILHLRAPKQNVRGKIIAILKGLHNFGKDDVVIIDLGQQQGLRQGDVLAIYNKETIKKLKEKHLWREKKILVSGEFNGELIVFKTFDNTSFGYIVHTERVATVMDTVTNPT